MRLRNIFCFLFLAAMVAPARADETILLANNPDLSPDGGLLVFDWNGDIWVAPSTGGAARALTQHPSKDREPKFSPDGREIAFISERDGSPQIYVMPAEGGSPARLTYHTAGYALEGWTPDGSKLLVSGSRDHYWNPRQAQRFFLINRQNRSGEELLFDDYGQNGSFSPDGRKLLFTREGTQWWRKGYLGSQSAQIWLYDLDQKSFTNVCSPDRGCTYGLWKPDGSGCYVVSAKNGTFNLYEHVLATGAQKQLTHFADDSVVQPCISHDGSTIVFRHLFDLYRYQPGTSVPPQKLAIRATGDRPVEKVERRVLTQATSASFSNDGLEIAMIAGGDLWVMDTELREPKQVTATAEEERSPRMSPDGQFLYFISEMYGECNIWRAERADKAKFWWQNQEFKLHRLTQDKSTKNGLKPSPDGSKLAFVRDRGDLCVMDADGSNVRQLVKAFSPIEFDWSPDSKWLVYAADDNDFNRDIWIVPLDGPRPAFNVSRSPFNDTDPVWSPDGKVIAYVGRREGTEVDIHYVFLRAEDDQTTTRDKLIEKAIEKINKARRPGAATHAGNEPPAARPPVVIDFEGIHERIRAISIPDSKERDLFWSPDSKRLAFTGGSEGKSATFVVDIPDDPKPKPFHPGAGGHARWLRNGQVVWLANGIPGSFPATPSAPITSPVANPTTTRSPTGRGARPAAAALPTSSEVTDTIGASYKFQALQRFERAQKNAAIFDLCWRTMRDQFYDERLGNRDWDGIRLKYIDAASAAPDNDNLGVVVNLMLGELNASHLGFYLNDNLPPSVRRAPPASEPPSNRWSETTAHLGLRFDPSHAGPGLKVRDIIMDGPADKLKSRVFPGESVTAIDGQPVDSSMDLTKVLNAPPGHEFALTVKSASGTERGVTIRPITYTALRPLLYKQWVEHNRRIVDKLSGGKLGYLHIDAMAMPSFYKFQTELYSVGVGKEGLVIDVRENGGGSTADHLLTALSQPEHAITVPRGGGPGYPQDRKVYACWNKPIIVMCNQNSFSNAEIFSHAIKTMKRGQLVGVPTAGGVISTGATPIMDVGFLRLPFRGWFLAANGRDMELNGAVPDCVLWPEPCQMSASKDIQLEKAVELLTGDVVAWKARPQPKLQKASEIEPNGKTDRPLAKEGSGE